VVLIIAVVAGCVVAAGVAWQASDPPSVVHSKGNVVRLAFLETNRVLLANHFGEVFASDNGGERWSRVADNVSGLAVADRTHIWGAVGWQGIHEPPSAAMSYSSDGGRRWSHAELDLPAGFGHDPVVRGRLPGVFINEPDHPPLLLMQNFQLMRPRPNSQFDTWQAIGKPVPVSESGRRWIASGLQHAHAIYVAAQGAIHLSTDEANTWDTRRVHDFFDARLTCHEATCFALLSGLGSSWNTVVSTSAGNNDWKPFQSLDLEGVRRAFATQVQQWGNVHTFGACAIVATPDGVLVGGIVNAGGRPWGAVLVLAANSPLRSLPGAVSDGVWALAVDQRGRLWVGGIGAFVQSANGWTRIWSSNTPT